MRKSIFLGWGLLIWFVATILTYLVGPHVFAPGNWWRLGLLFATAIPLVGAVTYPFYIWRGIPTKDYATAAICIAVPGMVLDVDVLLFFDWVFPHMADGAERLFSAWLLWAYGLILLTGLFPLATERSDAEDLRPSGAR